MEILIDSQGHPLIGTGGVALIAPDNKRWPDQEKDNELPSGYTRLVGLKRIAVNGYINTGVLADSTTGLEIYFSIPPVDYGSAAIFGIRRASGNTDTAKICTYVKTTAYYSGLAVVYGNADNGFVTGSGAGVPFGNNVINITIKGGKWYNWDRLIHDGSSQSFSNSDNTPIFLGVLAKSSSAIYNNSDALTTFYAFKVYSPQDVLTNDFVPVIDPFGNMGMYDKVGGIFKTVNDQNSWEPVVSGEYTYRSIRTRHNFSLLRSGLNYQSATGYGDWVIVATDTQRYFLLSNTPVQYVSGTLTQAGHVLECPEYNSDWHGNGCWFSDTKYDSSDPFPILYVSTDKQNCLLIAYRITESNGSYSISIVQKIYTPVGDTELGPTLYFHNYYGKPGGSTILEITYKQNSWSSSTNNALFYREFPLPVISAGATVNLTESDIIKKGTLPYSYANQNGGWNGKYFYYETGEQKLMVYKIDSAGASLVRTEKYNGSPAAKYYITTQEIEGLSWSSELGCFIQLSEPGYGLSHRVYAEDLEQYV